MSKIQIKVSDFSTRAELDTYIKREHGTNITENRKSDIEIVGKREDFKHLMLSDTARVFGIKCVITDEPTKFGKLIVNKTLRQHGQTKDSASRKASKK